MKTCKKTLLITTMIFSMGLAMTGCGTNDNDKQNQEATTQNEMNVDGTDADGVDGTGATDEDDAANGAGDAADNAADGVGEAAKDAADGAGEAAKDVADGVGEAADDLGEGIGDAVDNLGGGSFDQYDDAKKYLLDKLEKDNANANYEVREEKEDLVSYNHSDADARGYEFSVYETDNDEKIGIYYVDKETGKIFRYMGKDSIESY